MVQGNTVATLGPYKGLKQVREAGLHLWPMKFFCLVFQVLHVSGVPLTQAMDVWNFPFSQAAFLGANLHYSNLNHWIIQF